MSGRKMTKILIAEDEASAREALVMFFESLGFEVRASGDGGEVIEIGNEFKPDVLITDWQLEGECSGVSVAREIATLVPSTAIILISAYPIAELCTMTRDLKVEAYMEKPISLFELNTIVEGVAERVAE